MAKSAPKHFFSKLATIQMPRSVFNFDKVDTSTFTTDYLYPNYHLLVIPGDTVTMSYSNLTRFLPAIDVPMMDNVHCTVHFWFVPWRLVWKDTKYFFGEKQRGSTITSYAIPQIEFNSSTGFPSSKSIYDYFEIPPQGTDNQWTSYPSINALKYRSYNLIYDEWYMDEQRGSYSYFNDTSSNDLATDFVLLKRNKRFDYFTSSTLEPLYTGSQFGGPVSLSLAGLAPVYPQPSRAFIAYNDGTAYAGTGLNYPIDNGLSPILFDGTGSTGSVLDYTADNYGYYNTLGLTALSSNGAIGASSITSSSNGYSNTHAASGSVTNTTAVPVNLFADLRSSSAIQITQLREAFQLQAYLEIMNKSGQRLSEYIYGQYGVISPDARLQRPEFLGGDTFDISVLPVVQSSGTYITSSNQTTPQGTVTGYMVGGCNQKFMFQRSFTEFGYIIGIINFYADLTYFQGLNRDDYIQTPLDLPLPVFANLTDEQIDRKEIYATGDSSNDDIAFGYQERYGWAKYSKNTLRGLVRPNVSNSIGYWSLAQQLPSNVANNNDFITSNTPIANISAVTDEDNFICNQKFHVNVIRELPMYSDTMKWFSRS